MPFFKIKYAGILAVPTISGREPPWCNICTFHRAGRHIKAYREAFHETSIRWGSVRIEK